MSPDPSPSSAVHVSPVTVPGEGPPDAAIMLVGEQPGDQEDRAGRPFVGPAGRELDAGLRAAGLAREAVYVTNVVKQFHYKLRGTRRVRERPGRADIQAGMGVLLEEISTVGPGALILLGATAAQAVLGPQVRITRDRGHPLPSELAPVVLITAHPSSILRVPDRDGARQAFQEDLALIPGLLEANGS